MKCPFRLIRRREYTSVEAPDGTDIIVLDNESEEYADCYESQCPMWKYDICKGGYYCAQVNTIDDSPSGAQIAEDNDFMD